MSDCTVVYTWLLLNNYSLCVCLRILQVSTVILLNTLALGMRHERHSLVRIQSTRMKQSLW